MCADEGESQYDIFDPKNAKQNMRIGAAVFYVGIVVTIVSCSVASSGGGFIVAYGAIGFGAMQFVGGLLQTKKLKSIENSNAELDLGRVGNPERGVGKEVPQGATLSRQSDGERRTEERDRQQVTPVSEGCRENGSSPRRLNAFKIVVIVWLGIVVAVILLQVNRL